MKTAVLRVVGRTRFELVTNGLKGRYAIGARLASPLCAGRMARRNRCFLPALCQILPTYTGAVRRNVFTNAVHVYTALDTITLVNVSDHRDNAQTEPLLMRFKPLRRVRWSLTGNAAARAFCVSGRCFDEGLAAQPSASASRACGGDAVRLGVSGVLETQPLFKASSTSGRKLTQHTGQCRGRTHVPMALCQPRRRELSAGIATNRQADRFTRMAHDTGAWKLNADAQRAVVPHRMAGELPIGSLGAELSLKLNGRTSRSPPMKTEIELPPLPKIDPKDAIGYDAIRLVAGYTKTYVSEFAAAYARLAVEEALKQAVDAMQAAVVNGELGAQCEDAADWLERYRAAAIRGMKKEQG